MLVHVGSVVMATKKHKNSASEKMKNPFGHLHTHSYILIKCTYKNPNYFALYVVLVRLRADRVARGQVGHGMAVACSVELARRAPSRRGSRVTHRRCISSPKAATRYKCHRSQ